MPTFSNKTTGSGEPAIVGTSIHGEGVRGSSHAAGAAGVAGVNDNPSTDPAKPAGPGVSGNSTNGVGVIGASSTGIGVWGQSNTNTGTGGVSDTGIGVHGISAKGPTGVRGDCADQIGVQGNAGAGRGVEGNATTGTGVVGTSDTGIGIWGHSNELTGAGGVSETGHGVHGVSTQEHGVVGDSLGIGVGVFGASAMGEGVHGETNSPTVAAIAGFNNNPNGTGAAIFGRKVGEVGHAGFFDGHAHVTRDFAVDGNHMVLGSIFAGVDVVLPNADCAEDFTIEGLADAEPGTVMVTTEAGTLAPCSGEYDTCVAGVISGAGSYRPALILDRAAICPDRKPIALCGKVWCKVDAGGAPIRVGDLLTTSSTTGHAMRATDRARAFGAVLGKALAPLAGGRGLIPILVCLQ